VVKASGVGVFDALLEAAVLDLGRPDGRTLVAFWDVDAPATLDRVAADPADAFGPLVGRYDVVFTYGGGPPVIAAYERLGARACVPIYNAVDPDTHFPVARDDARFAADLGFLGNRMPDREHRTDGVLFRRGAASARPPLPARRQRLGRLAAAAQRALRRPRVHARPQRVQRDAARRAQHQPRGDGALRLLAGDARVRSGGRRGVPDHRPLGGHPRVSGAEREVLVAHHGADVAEHVRGLTPERARQIGDAARRRVLAEHTYAHRAVEVEKALAVIAGSGKPVAP
jgi:spore maturation protein CgeB